MKKLHSHDAEVFQPSRQLNLLKSDGRHQKILLCTQGRHCKVYVSDNIHSGTMADLSTARIELDLKALAWLNF